MPTAAEKSAALLAANAAKQAAAKQSAAQKVAAAKQAAADKKAAAAKQAADAKAAAAKKAADAKAAAEAKKIAAAKSEAEKAALTKNFAAKNAVTNASAAQTAAARQLAAAKTAEAKAAAKKAADQASAALKAASKTYTNTAQSANAFTLEKQAADEKAAKEKTRSTLLAELGGDNAQNRAIADGLQKQGVGSIKDIGVEKVLIPRHMEGTDEAANWVEDSYTNKYVNKATGEEINPTRLGIIQNDTEGVKGGDIFFHLNADDNGNVSFKPQWSPRAHGYLRDNPVGQAIMAIGSILPVTAPFAAVARGADALAHGNVLGGLASLAGAGGMANLGGLGSTLKDVSTGLNVANAVDKGNLAGAVSALTSNPNLAGGLGSTPIGGTGFNLGDVGNAAGLAANLASGNPNIGSALGAVGSLTGNQDLSTASKGISLAQGIMSGKPMSALNSLIGLGGLANAGAGSTSAPIDDRSIQANMGGVDPTAYLQSIPSGYSDVGVGGYDNVGLGSLANAGVSTTPASTNDSSIQANMGGVDPTASLQTTPTSYSDTGFGSDYVSAAPTTDFGTNAFTNLADTGFGSNNAATLAPPTQFDTSAFTNSALQQPAGPDLTALNTSGTTAMDDWNLDEDIPSYDLSQYLNGLNFDSGALTGAVTAPAVTAADNQGDGSLGRVTVQDYTGWQGDSSGVFADPTESEVEPGFDREAALEAERQRYLRSLAPDENNESIATSDGSGWNPDAAPTYGVQDFGASLTGVSTPTSDTFGSQWQTVGSDRIIVHDDGTATGINTETNETYTLDPKKVDEMVANNQLDTSKSGYFGATGGNNIAPGGGITATLKNGATGTLLPNGKVINPNTGTQIGKHTDVVSTTLGSADPTKTQTSTVTRTPTGSVTTSPKTTTTATTPTKTAATTPTKTAAPADKGTGLGALLPLLLTLLAASQSKSSSAPTSSGTIPALTASQTQTPYTSQTQAPTYRPGQGGISYFNPVQYTPKMAAGGIAGLGAARGRLLDGAGDGVSDSIPATIGRNQPARLARGEFVVDARTVAELGNGSTDAGADKLLKMMERVHQARKKAGRGKDSHADRHLPA